MLDECKGDKVEELLVAFLSVVLQKVSNDQGNDGSVVSQLVAAQGIPKAGQRSLLPLAIAHRASLTRLLRQKEQFRQRVSTFQRMLDEKEADLVKVVDRLTQVDGEPNPRDDHPSSPISTRRQFETHWRGDSKWIDALIGGGSSNRIRDPLFETSFNEIWPHVRDGTIDRIVPEENQDPLRDLENRVRSQRERLEHWREFEASIVQPGPKAEIGIDVNSRISRPKRLDLNLRKHLQPEDTVDATMKSQADESEIVNHSAGPTDEYVKLIDSFRSELDRLVQRKQQRPHAKLSEELEGHDPKSNNILTEDALKMYPSQSGSRSLLEKQLFDDPKRGDVSSRIPANISRRRSVPKPENSNTREPQDLDLQQREISKRPNHDVKNENLNITAINKATPTDSINLEANDLASEADEENVLAEMIVSSTRNAESSPMKPRPSLVERTRQSIAFTGPELANLESLTESVIPVPESEKKKAVIGLGRRASLIDRTRQSISSLQASSQELHKNTHKRRQPKEFPAKQFETPKKPALPALSELKEMTPPESLFREDVDCASVFKSRPKIATSPNISPTLVGAFTMQQESLFQEDRITPIEKGRRKR